MKFHVFISGLTLGELNEERIRHISNGFEIAGPVKTNSFPVQGGKEVEYFEQEMARETYPGLSAFESFTKWTAENH